MRTRLTRGVAWHHRVLFLLLLCYAGFAAGQAPPTQFGADRRPWLVMVARPDPADPARYIGVEGDDLSNAVALFRDGVRVRPTIPQILQRGDEMEMARDVICVWRYPIGDVYIDGATRVRVGSLDVLFGKIFARVRGLFSVENQNVVAGVEGTEFAFEVATDGTTQITVLDGTVLSSSKNLPWKPLRVTRGQAFTVTESGRQMRIGAAAPATLAQLRTWSQRVDNAVAVLAPREPQAQACSHSHNRSHSRSHNPNHPLCCSRNLNLSPNSRPLSCRPFRTWSSRATAVMRREGSTDLRSRDAGADFTNRRRRRTGDARGGRKAIVVRMARSWRAPLNNVAASSPTIWRGYERAVPRHRRPVTVVPEAR